MLLRILWIKYIMNIAVHFVGYLYVMELIKTWKVEQTKRKIWWYLYSFFFQQRDTLTH